MVHIQANMFVCAKSSIKKSTCQWIKLYRWINFVNHYKTVFQKKRPTKVVISLILLTRLKRTCQQKIIMPMNWIAIQYGYKRNGPKSWLFCWFLSPSFDNHECAYIYASLSFVFKGNKDRFQNNRFMQKRQSTIK